MSRDRTATPRPHPMRLAVGLVALSWSPLGPSAAQAADHPAAREAIVCLTPGAPKLFEPEAGWPAGTDASPAFTPDGRTVFFTHAVGPSRTIMVSHLAHNVWSKPEPAPFSGTWRDIEPAMAPDGSYLVFISNRPATPGGEILTGFFGGQPRPGAGGNIWRVNRVGAGWGDPIRLPDSVNSNSAIYSPAVTGDGSLYFNQPDPLTHKSRVYRAQATATGFQTPEPMSFSDGPGSAYDVAVAPDESFLVFSSGRAPATGDQSLVFVSFRRDGRWSTPVALQPLIEGIEARLSPDLTTLFISTETPSTTPEVTSSAPSASRIFRIPLHRISDNVFGDLPRTRRR
jgi:hypothetical protein